MCYIEAVSLMYEENILKKCDFVLDKNVYVRNQSSFKQKFDKFLDVSHKSNELFIVLDNTEWPEALGYIDWLGPE